MSLVLIIHTVILLGAAVIVFATTDAADRTEAGKIGVLNLWLNWTLQLYCVYFLSKILQFKG